MDMEKLKLGIRQLFTAVQMRQWEMVESATNQLHSIFLEAENAASAPAEEEVPATEEEAPHGRRRR